MEKRFRIGRWTVWPQRDQIEGLDENVRVTPKSMAVLECLARNHGEVVPRNDILDAVWPGADVTDDVLTHCVTELRKAFGDSPQEPRVIETIPRKGLRLMLPVIEDDDPEHDSTGTWNTQGSAEFGFAPLVVVMLLAGLLGWFYYFVEGIDEPVAADGLGTTIAVMPFVDLSEDKDQLHLTEGLAEELVLRLSELEGLSVIGPRSVSILADVDDPREAAAKLAVDYMLDGSLRRSGDDLRIVISLLAPGESSPAWMHTFDRRFSELLAVQDRIAESVALALSIELDVGREHPNIWATSNPDAYEEVLLGNLLFDFDPQHMTQARRHYTRATVLDPNFIAAWLQLAQINNVSVSDVMSPENVELRRICESAIARAIELAPDSVDVLLVASEVHFNARDWAKAKRYYDRALEKDALRVWDAYTFAALPQVHFNMLYKLGHVNAQIELLEDSYRLQPYAGTYSTFLPQAYLAAGRVQEALREVELAYADPKARVSISHVGLSIALSIDDPVLIEQWLTRTLESMPARPSALLVDMYDLLGEPEAALASLRDHGSVHPYADYYVQQWASYYGDDDLALEAMRRAADLWSFWIPLHKSLRVTEGFKQLVSDMGLVDYWREFGWGDYCRPISEDDFECV